MWHHGVMMLKPWLCCLAVLSLVACGHSKVRHRGGELPEVSFKSSLAVLLDHRDELALTPEQVDHFEKMDFTLHEQNLPLQLKLDELRAQDQKDVRASHGGYMGGGAHDVHGGKGGDLGAPPDAVAERQLRRQRLERTESTVREMQDNDSQAYVRAEQSLTEAQKPSARALFSKEREGLLKQLEVMHTRLRKEDY